MANVLLGCGLMFVSTFIHAAAMVLALDLLTRLHRQPVLRSIRVLRPLPIAALVLVMFLASLLQAAMWGGIYVWIGAFDRFEDAGYFSMVTYTTLGYGDITLTGSWRLLSSIEAGNGVIMFGWSTALIYAAVNRVYFQPRGQDGA